MNIISKEHIFPIILKNTYYEDRFGNKNSFIEMNPSLYISEDGSYTILVRTINYLKYPNNKFTVYGNKSTSIYSIMRGKINDSFNYNIFIYNSFCIIL